MGHKLNYGNKRHNRLESRKARSECLMDDNKEAMTVELYQRRVDNKISGDEEQTSRLQ